MKVLLVDDHPLILSALRTVIQGLADEVDVVGVDSGAAARQALANDPDYDLVLLDLKLGDADGFDVLADMRAHHPSVPVVVVSASDRGSDVIRAIDLGAMGFVPKRSSNELLVEALRQVVSGGIYVPPMSLGGAIDAAACASHRAEGQTPLSGPHGGPTALAGLGLTPRQTEVLALLLQGKPNKLIAREMQLSVETIKDHVAAVLRALGVGSRTQAVLAVGQMTHPGSGFQAWRPSPR